jgi:aspartate aminotransferase-like enzyme
MPLADLQLPTRLLAGGGPSSPDPRVLRALATPLIGQFDPDFTAIMDDVVQLARATFLTSNARCFAVSGLAAAGLEAILNSLLTEGDPISIQGGPAFVAKTADMARRYGASFVPFDEAKFVVVPFVDPVSASILPVRDIAARAHAQGASLIVEATMALAARELRVDDWGIDVCVAGVDYAVGAPPGMALVTYTAAIEAHLAARESPPRTSYLDLAQLQAYWSPERLNHHTAPTSLVYGLREALRLVHEEGLLTRWDRHERIGELLRQGLEGAGLNPEGSPPYAIVHLPPAVAEAQARQRLLDDFGIYLTRVAPRSWRLGLLGADAGPDAVHRVLTALEKVLTE